MRGLLVSGGAKTPPSLLKKYSKNAFIICADGGIKSFIGTDIIPDILIGDMDSISEEGLLFLEENNIKFKKFPARKNLTDTELALSYLVDENYKEIIILSATGTRLDHTMANISLLESLYINNIDAKIVNEHNIIKFAGPGEYIVEKGDFKYISLLAADKEIIYSTEGMSYEVKDFHLRRGCANGISNEICGDFAKIKIKCGSGFLIQSKD